VKIGCCQKFENLHRDHIEVTYDLKQTKQVFEMALETLQDLALQEKNQVAAKCIQAMAQVLANNEN